MGGQRLLQQHRLRKLGRGEEAYGGTWILYILTSLLPHAAVFNVSRRPHLFNLHDSDCGAYAIHGSTTRKHCSNAELSAAISLGQGGGGQYGSCGQPNLACPSDECLSTAAAEWSPFPGRLFFACHFAACFPRIGSVVRWQTRKATEITRKHNRRFFL